VMTPGVIHVFADQEVEEVVRLMEDRQIRRVPVLSREERLVGIVSLGDIAMSSNPAFSGMALRDVSEPRSPNARQRRLAEQSEPAGGRSGSDSNRGENGGGETEGRGSRRRSPSANESRRSSSGKTRQRKGASRKSGRNPKAGRKSSAGSRAAKSTRRAGR
jgi:hypothetical protein